MIKDKQIELKRQIIRSYSIQTLNDFQFYAFIS